MSLLQGQSSAAKLAFALPTDLDRGLAITELFERSIGRSLPQTLAYRLYELRVGGPGENASLVLFNQPCATQLSPMENYLTHIERETITVGYGRL